MPPKDERHTFHFHTGGFTNAKPSAAEQRIRDAMHEALRSTAPPEMRDLNARPVAKPKPVPTVKIEQGARPDARDGHAAYVYVLVPTIFGRLEPLLDGDGEPLDFARELGDPRGWKRDMTKDVQAIVARAIGVCQALVRSRAPA